MMEGVRFRGDTPGERKSVHKRKKESRTQPGCRGGGGSLAFLKCTGTQQVCAPLGAAARQAPPSTGFSGQRILEWVAMPSSRGSSRPRDRTHVSYISCVGERVLYHLCHQEVVKQNSKLRMYVKLCTANQFLAFQL